MLRKYTLDIAEGKGRRMALAGGLMTMLLAGVAQGQELGKLSPGKVATDLLGGRLRIRMPKNAKVEARGRSIMAALEAVTEETRVVLNAGKERLVLMAWEMFALAGDDLAKAVRADIASWGDQAKGAQVEPLVVPKPLADARLVLPAVPLSPAFTSTHRPGRLRRSRLISRRSKKKLRTCSRRSRNE